MKITHPGGPDKGKLKQKGAYVSDVGPGAKDPQWHKDHSAMVVPKIAVRYLQHGGNIESMVATHPDKFDFMLRAKVRRSDKLLWGEQEIQRISRYYVCGDDFGRHLTKQMVMTDTQRAQCEAGIPKLVAKIEGYQQKLATWEAQGKTGLASYVKTREVMLPRAREELAERREQLRLGGKKTAIQAGWNVQVCNHMRDAVFPINVEYYASEIRKLVEPFNRTGRPA